MPSLHVRNLDEGLVRKLKRRAAANGRSVEAEHRAILDQALNPADHRAAWLEEADRIRAMTSGLAQTSSESLQREGRDER